MIINDKIGSRKTTNMDISIYTGWGPSSLAKLVQITIITTAYDTQIAIFRWGYKQKNITGGPLTLRVSKKPTWNCVRPQPFHSLHLHLFQEKKHTCNHLGHLFQETVFIGWCKIRFKSASRKHGSHSCGNLHISRWNVYRRVNPQFIG